ncbi:MAG: hypothetical protein FJ144_18190 [Deltaproteobacteria bacterium]|nr:hypothetical protein [Deltaproteobacteria bacterium]
MKSPRAPVPLAATLLPILLAACSSSSPPSSDLQVGAAAVPITPCGESSAWDGPVTGTGVWGETYTDQNGNGRYDVGEPFTDDPRNDALDASSAGKYDGIYMAGFGNDRIAKGCHDDLWARVLVIDDGEKRVAFTVVDLVGTLKYGRYYGFAHAEAQVDPAAGITQYVHSSTHNHEGPDSLGLWGTDTLVDGKFPLYLTFVDTQLARAVSEAVADLQPVGSVRAYRTDPTETADLRGLQVRTGCRPPFLFDEEVRGIAFFDEDGAAIASLLNWATHPESLEDENELISSDFIHWIREEVESGIGGTAVYFSADLGASEIVGDSCVNGANPRNADGSNELDDRSNIGFARTERIGRIVGGVLARGLRDAPEIEAERLDVKSAHYRLASSNPTFELGREIGLLDLDPAIYDPALCPGTNGLCGPGEQHLVTLSDDGGTPLAQILSVPGEVFPELYLGVATHRRTDCPAADTGAPAEPSIRDAMAAPFRFIIGLSPDEIGYIVPGYDFHPANIFDEAVDPCDGMNYDPEIPRRTVPTHYHETLSVGAEAAAYVTCKGVELLQGPEAIASEPACSVVE